MRRYWGLPVVVAVLIVCLLVTFTSLSQTQEMDLKYSYRFGCPDGSTSDYCPKRYRSLVTNKDTYGVGEKIYITLSNLKDFEYLVEKVEIHFQPIFEHSHELVYVENKVGPIAREKNSWVWAWDQKNGVGELVGAGRGYIRITLNCCKNYRTHFRISKGARTGEISVPTEEEIQIPRPPEALYLQPLSPTEVKLTWNDNSDNENGFRIYRDGREIATVGPNVTSYTDTGLEGNTSYLYRVAACNEGGESSLGEGLEVTTSTAVSSTPISISATPLSPAEIKLTWTDNSEDEDGFKIYRDGDRITELDPNRKSYVDTGLAEGTDYTYMISSFNGAGESFITYVLKRTTPFEPPPAPDQLVTEPLSPTEVKLTWNDNSDNEDGFHIYRDGREIATVGPNVTSYTDTGLEGNTSYLYRVAACNEGGESLLKESLEVTTPTEVSSAPTIISANPLSPTEVRLTWGDTSDNEDGFRVYRNGNKIATVGPDTTSYVDTELKEDTRYTYRVASYNGAGESSPSFEVKVKTPGEVPAPPTELRTTTLSSTSIALTWKDNSDSEDGFIVYRDGDKVADLGPNTTSYTHGRLSEDTRYCYEVAGYNSAGKSGCTNQICSMTQPSIPAPPGNLEATPLSPNKISLTWIDNSEDEDGFMVYRDGEVIADLGSNITSYVDSGLTANETYSYLVSSYNRSGKSGLMGSGVVKTPEKERDRRSKELQIPAFNHLLAGVGIVTMVLTYIYQD